MAYDLLIVTQDTPYYGWQSAKRFLKMEFPPRHREIPYANIYIGTQNIVESRIAPFTWFARSEEYCFTAPTTANSNALKLR